MIRKPIENLLKGGEELEEVHEANHATAKGMMQQVVVILEGLEKPESVATGWVKDFDSAKVKVIGHLAEGLRGYLTANSSKNDSETDAEVSDSTAAGKDDSLQGEPLQGEAKISSTLTNLEGEPGEVTEEAIQELFKEEKIGMLSDEEKAPFEGAEQKKDIECPSGNTGNSEGIPTDEKLPSPYLAHATSPSLHSAYLDPSDLKESAGKYGDTVALGSTESFSLLDIPSLISGDSKEAPSTTAPQAEEERMKRFKIQQQLSREGAGPEDMNTPVRQRSLVYDVLKETDHMALATTRVVAKMNKLEVKLDQQVAVLQRQSESFRVHYLEGQKAAAQQASKASRQHQLLATQVDKNTEQNGKIVSLLRELKDGLKGSSERTEVETKSCFEFAASVDIDHQKRLEECQNRDYKRHAELREEVHALQAMVSSLVAHVQGLGPPEPAVSEPTQVPAQSQEPADEVSPEMKKLAKAHVKARRGAC
jgi:hypothetical protein